MVGQAENDRLVGETREYAPSVVSGQPEIDGVGEAFIRTPKRDYTCLVVPGDAKMVLHLGLKFLSPGVPPIEQATASGR